MRALRVGVGVFIILCVVGVGVYLVFRERPTADREPTPEPTVFLTDFVFPDRSGNPVALEDIKADVRVINFWASWSPYSRTELPALAELKRVYGERVAVVALNRDTNPAEGREFFDGLSLSDGVVALYDQHDTYYKTVGGYNMPETLFVDEEGGVLVHVHGPMTYDEMKQTLDRLLQ